MFFTLIIPAYNCQTTINRLLDSIVNQNYNDLKVLVIDDSSSERLCQDYINTYKDKLNIEYYIRRADLYNCHCPGNTRHDGLRRALEEDTKYILFADCDDEFVPDSFSDIEAFLKENNYPETIQTPFYAYNEKTNQPMYLEQHNVSWLHGKFYKKDFLIENNIQFQIDLASHEDIFFNQLVKGYLIKKGSDIVSLNKIIYKWYSRDESESHHHEIATGENFLELHYLDWIKSVMDPIYIICKQYPKDLHKYTHQIIVDLMLGYLYFQGFIYNDHGKNNKLCKKNYKIYKDTLIQAMDFFNLTKKEIIVVGYQQAQIYTICRTECIKSVGNFVEEQSFKDFINDINIYE